MPDWKQIVREHLAPLQIPPERELEIVEELAQDLEAVYEDALARGATEPEAYARALREAADWRVLECELSRVERPVAYRVLQQPIEFTEPAARIRRGGICMESLLQDLRYGLRTLLKNPGFTAIAVLTLAVGIGATTAVFSLVRSILLRPLPYAAPERLALIWGTNQKAGQLRDVISGPSFLDLRRQNTVFEETAAFTVTEMAARGEQGTGVIPRLEVTPEFFSVLGAQPLLGRVFEAGDGLPGRDQVALLTHGYWQRQFGGDPAIVGVAGDVREVGLDKPAKPMMFVPYQRAPRPVMGLFVQTSEPPERMLPIIQRAVWSVDPAQPIFNVNRLEQLVADSMSVQRLTLLISAVLAALAAALTAVGIYGVVGYATSQRTREIGLRMALGAGRRNVFWLVVKQGMAPAAFGLISGLAGALGVTRLLAGQLYGVRPADPLTYAGVALLLMAVALLACTVPAQRATKIEPLTALRHE